MKIQKTVKQRHAEKLQQAKLKSAEILATFSVRNPDLEKFLTMELMVWWCDGAIDELDRMAEGDAMAGKN